ncbi:helix-turn-helix transcriptional regulator [Nissabacter archeti]|uniref:helix-turn-helix transcriptional regulator n=1 Tax=Nissabacter archeti TaxID=1917880 RepID=UPI0009333B8D|nr:PAS domain-containing protein [Nissabacter archeti]
MNVEHKQQSDELIRTLEAAMDALASTIAGNHEIVLHDLTKPAASVHKIINGHVSGRKKGDSLLSGPDKDTGFAGLLSGSTGNNRPVVIKNYKTVTFSGKVLNSASTIYYSDAGEPLVAFCNNIDVTPYEMIRQGVDLLLNHQEPYPDDNALAVDTLLAQTLNEIISKHTLPGKKTQKAQRLKIVNDMRAKGIFKMKGGVQHAAAALGVSRYTIYNDLEALSEE